ncbi:DUF4144 family protein [Shewanella sp. SR44-3]|uniref:DUF4144 family protein n=1 Tax=unclassified Shewanella TaxID=196818 RepID=UPI0015FC0DFF|nr:DUF4144 family protein [Shewanella sp. SR44-3]MBB1268882.1 hypothetical protein [Shewanella sp. SR44-3]
MMPTSDVIWPAIIKLQQTEELVYLACKSAWIDYVLLEQHVMDPQDELIDSQGWVYALKSPDQLTMQSCPGQKTQLVKQLPSIVATEQQMTSLQLIPLVRQYAAFLEQCCSAKLAFNRISEGIEIIAALEQNS